MSGTVISFGAEVSKRTNDTLTWQRKTIYDIIQRFRPFDSPESLAEFEKYECNIQPAFIHNYDADNEPIWLYFNATGLTHPDSDDLKLLGIQSNLHMFQFCNSLLYPSSTRLENHDSRDYPVLITVEEMSLDDRADKKIEVMSTDAVMEACKDVPAYLALAFTCLAALLKRGYLLGDCYRTVAVNPLLAGREVYTFLMVAPDGESLCVVQYDHAKASEVINDFFNRYFSKDTQE